MILNFSDFLEEFKNNALDKISKEDSNISHRPTIGNIYEGLTSEILNKTIFDKFNLKIVEKSFIYNDEGKQSDELDCIIVVGDGKKINFTNQYCYHVNDVIAVVQVKKNLYAKDILDSHFNLRSIIKLYDKVKTPDYAFEILKDAYKSIVKKNLPSKERYKRFTLKEKMIYEYFLSESRLPLRIVIGYFGYKTEENLREGFFQNLEKLLVEKSIKGISPYSFPSLYMCGDSLIVKNNGMPIAIPLIDDEFYFPILTTTKGRPMYYLLELIWTRLSYRFEIKSDIFDDNNELDFVHPFISVKENINDKNLMGWDFTFHELSEELLNKESEGRKWTPTLINQNIFYCISLIQDNGFIDLENRSFITVNFDDKGIIFAEILEELLNTDIVYVDENKLYILPDNLEILFTPEGQVFAGDNKNGQLTIFIQELAAYKD